MSGKVTLSGLKKLEDLETASCSADAVRAVREILERGSDFDAYKVNAFRVAARIGVRRHEVLRAFLFATRIGLFDLHWDIHCPSCRGLPEFHKHLMGLANRAHCPLCQIDWDLDIEEQVEVSFTANPDARPIRYVHFKDRDFEGKMQYFEEMLAREGRTFAAADCALPERTVSIEAALDPGRYLYYVADHREHARPLSVTEEAAPNPHEVALEVTEAGEVHPASLVLPRGPVRFSVHSRFSRMTGFLVKADGPLSNWVSAAYVTSQQDFRDLFAGEFLSPDASFGIRNITLLFTDLKSSTELYERLGDSRAFSLVNEHFAILEGIIRQAEGGIVKTIGDAVMASFPVNGKGVEAAVAILSAFENEKGALGGLRLKMGLHRGPAIAVTTNRNLDYFGRTVNIAARVQGESREGEVLLSDAVLEDPAVRPFLEQQGLEPISREVRLKGLGKGFTLHALSPTAGAWRSPKRAP